MWWVQPVSRTDVSAERTHAASVPAGSSVGEPVVDGAPLVQLVVGPVVLTQVPVEVPDVVPPADHLADETLDRSQGCSPVVVRPLGRPCHLDRLQQPQIQRHRQQRVGHPAVLGHDRVLVPTEVRQPVPDEVGQGRQRLRARGREQPRTVLTEELTPSPSSRSRSSRTAASMSSSPGHTGSGSPSVRSALRRRLAVLGVEVPPAADRFSAVHQQPDPAPVVAVEVLHQKSFPAPTVGPGGELGPARAEAPGRQSLDVALVGQPVDQVQRRPRRRLDDLQRSCDLGQPRAVGVRPQVRTALPELGRPVSHRRQHQVRLLAVEPSSAEHRGRLDQQHVGVGVVEEVWSELVAEEPPHHHRSPPPPLRPVSYPGHVPATLPKPLLRFGLLFAAAALTVTGLTGCLPTARAPRMRTRSAVRRWTPPWPADRSPTRRPSRVWRRSATPVSSIPTRRSGSMPHSAPSSRPTPTNPGRGADAAGRRLRRPRVHPAEPLMF